MQALILGVGDAFTSSHFGSSALIQGPQGFVLLDCPDPIHRVLTEATGRAGWSATAADVDDVLLTHLHGDHCNGLESFGFARFFLRNRNGGAGRPRLHTSGAAAERVWERLAPAMDNPGASGTGPRRLEDFYDLRVLTPAEPATVAGLTVRCRFTKHPIPTIGLLISDGTATLGWSSDTPFERKHIDWLAQADLIVHESNVGPAHTPIDDLNALPDDLRAKIRLIHLPDDFDPSVTDMQPLTEGEVLQVRAKRRSDGATERRRG